MHNWTFSPSLSLSLSRLPHGALRTADSTVQIPRLADTGCDHVTSLGDCSIPRGATPEDVGGADGGESRGRVGTMHIVRDAGLTQVIS